jgi:hypothetical protein
MGDMQAVAAARDASPTTAAAAVVRGGRENAIHHTPLFTCGSIIAVRPSGQIFQSADCPIEQKTCWNTIPPCHRDRGLSVAINTNSSETRPLPMHDEMIMRSVSSLAALQFRQLEQLPSDTTLYPASLAPSLLRQVPNPASRPFPVAGVGKFQLLQSVRV